MRLETQGNQIWIKQSPVWNTSSDDNRPMITITVDGYIVFSFWTRGTVSGQINSGNEDIVVVKLDSNGNIIWTKQQSTFNTPDNDTRPSITCTSDNGIVIGFISGGTIPGESSTGTDRLIIFKMDSMGNVLWIKESGTFNPIISDAYYPPSVTTDGVNIYAAYYTYGSVSGGTNIGGDDIVVLKLDQNGNTVWVVQNDSFNTTNNDYLPLIAANSSSLYLAFITLGETSGNSNVGSSDVAIAKINQTDGSIIWIKQSESFDTPDGDAGSYHFGLCVDADSNAYIAFQTYGVLATSPNVNTDTQIIIAKFTPSGINEWSWQIPNDVLITDGSVAPTISVDSNKNLFVSFQMVYGTVSGGESSGSAMAVLFKLSQNSIRNSFPLIVSPYLALDTMLVYTKETVDTVAAHGALPETTRVSWAPVGIPAGSLLRGTGRSVVATVSASNPLFAYRFQSVQLIVGARTEGMSGGPTDMDPWGCGYICTWAADGVAPVY